MLQLFYIFNYRLKHIKFVELSVFIAKALANFK